MTAKKNTAKKVAAKRVVAKKTDSEIKLNAPVYTQTGKKASSVDLPASVFGLPWNGSLVHQVVTGMQANARHPWAHAKTRGEVRGGGKKPWQQKGTGRARHGSIRSPIWVGGGVAHGPRNEKVYAQKINKKMRVKALYAVLSQKMRDGNILFMDTLAFDRPKTAEAKKVLNALSKVKGFEKLETKNTNTALIAIPGKDAHATKSFRNFGNIAVTDVKDLNPVSALKYTYLFIVNPDSSLSVLASRGNKK